TAARVASSASPNEIRITEAAFRELSSSRRLLCRGLGPVTLKGLLEPMHLMALEWRDKSRYAAKVRIAETGEEFTLPQQDTITFGRLREQNGIIANDVVLQLREREQGLRISRWHFELRRTADGFRLRSVTDQATEIDGQAVARGEEAPIRVDSQVRLANAVTLEFLPEVARPLDESGITTGYKT
ncbi:MAG: hypothetical protein JST92_26215, partial [Deltaproteobacteria bacterium]|nr:hypothetical protein [Deltaproteobacteria bacterium]